MYGRYLTIVFYLSHMEEQRVDPKKINIRNPPEIDWFYAKCDICNIKSHLDIEKTADYCVNTRI